MTYATVRDRWLPRVAWIAGAIVRLGVIST
jgi:hypothetical protein